MKTVLHKSGSRGHTKVSWLNSHHTFSFADYYDPKRVHFGALRVLNDDAVAPGKGFDVHPHKNMEIISIPLKGKLKHGDSIDNARVIEPGEIQTMSAGTGIFHSEMNGSETEPVEFLQIWVLPRKENTQPKYKDFDIKSLRKENEPYAIVAPDGSTPASLLQDCWFSLLDLDADRDTLYTLHSKDNGVYIFLIEGEVEVNDVTLNRRDGLGVYETGEVKLSSRKDSQVLFIEVPMI